MAGLVGYASSDEEDEVEKAEENLPISVRQAASEIASAAEVKPAPNGASDSASLSTREEAMPIVIGPVPQNATPLGPSLPAMGDDSFIGQADDNGTPAPSSPYSANRALIQDLTLPSVPNLDIPPSPPGSPPPGANKKFEQFLALKRKGTHFNAKLEQSAALKNPALMDKLMGFVDVTGVAQYETTLPLDLWNPKGFPDWAFRNRLRKSREAVAKEREAERTAGGRSSIDFVPSSSTPTSGTAAGGLNKVEKRKRL